MLRSTLTDTLIFFQTGEWHFWGVRMTHVTWKKHLRDPPGIFSQGTTLLRTADIVRSISLSPDMTSARYGICHLNHMPDLSLPSEANSGAGLRTATLHCALCPNQSGDPASSPGFWSLACSGGRRQGAKGARLSSCGLWGPSNIPDLRADPSLGARSLTMCSWSIDA